MAKAVKGIRAKKMLSKVRKDLKIKVKKAMQRPIATRRNATVVLAQGAAAVPRRNFGTQVASRNANPRALAKCLDARLPRTLGLPRAVGPYTIIRTTRLFQTDSSFVLFCPFTSETPTQNTWLNWCGIEAVDTAKAINAENNTKPITMPLSELGAAAELVPAALTVQVMNPASLQDAEGVFAMTRVNQQLVLGGNSQSYELLMQQIVSFYTPRLLTGGKLALRGVKSSAYPLNMNEYASFQALVSTNSDPFTWDSPATAENDSKRQPAALSPICFIQENKNPQTLEFLITIEWRVRFDPGNPATASHMHHDTLSDEAWNAVVKTMSAAGHGIEELTEDVAEAGALADGAMRFAAML